MWTTIDVWRDAELVFADVQCTSIGKSVHDAYRSENMQTFGSTDADLSSEQVLDDLCSPSDAHPYIYNKKHLAKWLIHHDMQREPSQHPKEATVGLKFVRTNLPNTPGIQSVLEVQSLFISFSKHILQSKNSLGGGAVFSIPTGEEWVWHQFSFVLFWSVCVEVAVGAIVLSKSVLIGI